MKRLGGDIRALAAWWPVRAAHEALTRTGLLGRFLSLRSRGAAPAISSPFESWPPPELRRGWTHAADLIASGTVSLFGSAVEVGSPPDWLADGIGGSWRSDAAHRIDLYGDPERDVKRAWELGRHRHLVVLARAAVEDPTGPHVSAIETHLESWFDQSPPEIGVHWRSSLELALRALAWLEVLDLVGDRLRSSVHDEMARHLYHSGRHIVANLGYTLSSMRNNHLIGDAVGLVAIGKAFPGDRAGARWQRLGDRMLAKHVPRHFSDDGASIEDSLGYRGFVMELLAARIALGDAPDEIYRAVESAAAHFERAGVGAGPVPRFGDWDGGTALAVSPAGGPPSASLEAARRIIGVGHRRPAVTDGSDAGGGLGRISRDPWTVYLKAGGGVSHRHADLLSVAIAVGGTWVTGDPANAAYNRSAAERDHYRASEAHNVLRIEGIDQGEPHRRFRFLHRAAGSLGAPIEAGPFRVMWGSHDAYARLDPPRHILRACLVSAGAVIVVDWILGEPGRWNLSLPLGPDVVHEPTHGGGGSRTEATLHLPGSRVLGLSIPGVASPVRGSAEPIGGWWADDYDRVRPATRLDLSGAGGRPVWWALWRDGRPHIETDAEAIVVEGRRLTSRGGDGSETVLVAEQA